MSRSLLFFLALSVTRLNHIQSRLYLVNCRSFLSSNYSSPGILLFGEPRDLISKKRAARNRANETPCSSCIFTARCLSWEKYGRASPAHFFSHLARRTKRAKEGLLVIYVCPCGKAMSGIVKVIVSFFRKGEEVAIERHRSRVPVDKETHKGVSELKQTSYRVFRTKGAGTSIWN